MLVLDRKSPVPATVPVPLGGGAVIHVRPATSADYFLVKTRVVQLAAGLKDGDHAAEQVGLILGEEIARGNVADPQWISAVIDRLILVELTVICAASWERVVEKVGDELVPLSIDEATIALLLRDASIAGKVQAVVMGAVHAEAVEGKGSAASRNGAAAAAETTAPTAGQPASPAPPAAEA